MNRPFELTASVVRSAKPQAKEYALLDFKLPGLSVRVQPSGAKSWVLRLSEDGKARRVTLGRVDDLTPRAARALAAHQVASLRIPTVRHIPRRGFKTFGDLAKAFRAAKTRAYKRSTLKSLDCYLEGQLIPAFGKTSLVELSTPQVADWFLGYSRRSPGGANRALDDFRAIMSYARSHGLTSETFPDPSNPLRRNKRPPRGRLLSTMQLASLGEVLYAASSRQADAAQAIHLMLLTGCRSGEILRLQWDEVKDDRLSLFDAKTGPRDVMLTPVAKKVLRRRFAARKGQAQFVFDSRLRPGKPLTTIHTTWVGIRAAAGIPDDVRLHDLRHTYASHSIMGGETLDRTGALLGHSDPETTEIYSHLEGPHLLAAAETVSREIAKRLGMAT